MIPDWLDRIRARDDADKAYIARLVAAEHAVLDRLAEATALTDPWTAATQMFGRVQR